MHKVHCGMAEAVATAGVRLRLIAASFKKEKKVRGGKKRLNSIRK